LSRIPTSLKDLFSGLETLLEVEDISQSSGFLQGIEPCTRLLALSSIIVSSLFASSFVQLSILYAPIPLLVVFSKAPLGGFIKRNLFVPLPAIALGVPAFFMTGGNMLWSAQLGPIFVSATIEGFQRLIIFAARLWVCYGCLSLLTLVSGIDGLLSTLTALKAPPLLVQLFSLTYRYIYLSVHECVRVLFAREARTIRQRRRLNFDSLRSLAGIASLLLLRSYDRGERVYLAMKARGFSLEATVDAPLRIRPRDLLFFLAVTVYSVLVVALVASRI